MGKVVVVVGQVLMALRAALAAGADVRQAQVQPETHLQLHLLKAIQAVTQAQTLIMVPAAAAGLVLQEVAGHLGNREMAARGHLTAEQITLAVGVVAELVSQDKFRQPERAALAVVVMEVKQVLVLTAPQILAAVAVAVEIMALGIMVDLAALVL